MEAEENMEPTTLTEAEARKRLFIRWARSEQVLTDIVEALRDAKKRLDACDEHVSLADVPFLLLGATVRLRAVACAVQSILATQPPPPLDLIQREFDVAREANRGGRDGQ